MIKNKPLGIDAIHPVWAALGLSLYVLLSANHGLIKSAFVAGGPVLGQQILLMLAVSSLVVLWQAALWLLIAPTRWARPLALAWIVVSVAAGYLQQKTGVVLDPAMLRNAFRTDWPEARELVSVNLILRCALFVGLAWIATRHVRIKPLGNGWWRALLARLGWVSLVLGLTVMLMLSVMQPLASWMRNDKAARYLITPSNVLWSSAVALFQDAQVAAKPRKIVAADAKAGASWAQRKKPMIVIVVVGETARAANWGLNRELGQAVYPKARDTTPELAKLDVINFPRVESCGTNTEVSVPCMFSFLGRKNYDEEAIRTQDSVLHVLARAGVKVHWRDNQSGCKGVCQDLPQDTVDAKLAPALCTGGRCLDEALIVDLDERLRNAQGTQVWLLHQIGNHGPAYYRRHPPQFAHFQPACQSDDLHRCTLAEITNSYDNALRYTDHILAETVRKLIASSDSVDSALIYVSDHGESLGEKGLFLHGMPRAIAPREQLEVPMMAWFSAGMDAARGGQPGCLKREFARAAQKSLSHDYLTHTLLGMFDVQTSLKEAAFDLTRECPVSAPTAKQSGS